jgi:hypothetical protein
LSELIPPTLTIISNFSRSSAKKIVNSSSGSNSEKGPKIVRNHKKTEEPPSNIDLGRPKSPKNPRMSFDTTNENMGDNMGLLSPRSPKMTIEKITNDNESNRVSIKERPNSPKNPRMSVPPDVEKEKEKEKEKQQSEPLKSERIDPPPSESPKGNKSRKNKRRKKPATLIATQIGKVPDYESYSELEKTRAWTALENRLDDLQALHSDWDIGDPDPEKETLTKCHHRYIQYLNDHKREKFIAENSENYIIGMVIFWLLFEVICTMILNLPAGGYTMLQFSMMHRYEDILVDIGEEAWELKGKGKKKRGTFWDIMWSSLVVGIGFVAFNFFLKGLGEDYAQRISGKLVTMLVGNESEGGNNTFKLAGVAEVFKTLKGLMNGDLSVLGSLLG